MKFTRNGLSDIVKQYYEIWFLINTFTSDYVEHTKEEIMAFVMEGTRGHYNPKIIEQEVGKLFHD